MKHPLPARPEIGSHGGLAYALFLPKGETRAGVVILHGAGSAKESHFDYARRATAVGMAALAFDARGHGRSEGEFGPDAIDDVLEMCSLLRGHARVDRIALRGSSMGGFCAIHAGAASDGEVGAVVAICPAPEDMLLRSVRAGTIEGFRTDRERLEPWLASISLERSAAALSPRTALLLLHARGDEQVPYTVSEGLHAAAGEPKRLLLLPGGHHRSIQHDVEMQGVSLAYVERALRG